MLRVRLLGEPSAERDGEPIELTAPLRRLLAYLVLHPGPHHRDALASCFWPDAADGVARANLRTAVWGLRRAVGADTVVTTRTDVGLDASRVATDVDEPDPGGPELLAGWPQDWAARARDEHRNRLVRRLDALADDAEAASDPSAAAAHSRARCSLTPLDEPAHCALMRRLAAAGDRAGAVVVGRELVRRLHDELGVPPAPPTRSALAALRHPEQAGTGTGPPRRPLFGRAAELRALTDAWSEARAGRGRVVVVTGEGGIGKTRLVTELARRADNAGARVAVGAGVDVGDPAPLAMWQELARELVHVVAPPPDGTRWPAELGRLAPDLANALGRADVPAPVAAPELERLRVSDAVLRLVEWAASGRPVLLVAEDVHRADRASMALCAHIGRRLAALPVLFLLTRRDRPARPEADALLADVGGRGVDVGEIDLGPMDDAALAEVARASAALDEDDVGRAVRAAEGNPLLAVESARALAAGLSDPPPTLRAAVRAVLGTLDHPGRELLECVAAAGRALTAPEIAALGVPDGTEQLVLDTGLLNRASGSLRFRHALLAEATRAERRDACRSHLRAGTAIERAAADDPGADPDAVAAEVAGHLRAAGRDDLAGPRWERAARHARTLGALPEAAGFWGEAVRCRPDAGDLHLELAEVHGWSGRSEEFEREWRLALDLLEPDELAAAWCRRGTVLRTVVCRPSASLEAYRRAAASLRADAPVRLRVDVLLGQAWGESSAADPRRAEELLEQASALVPEPDDATVAEIENVRLMTVIRLGRFDECTAVADRGGSAAARARRPDLAYAIRVNAASALSAGGDVEGALAQTEAAVDTTRGIAVLEQPCLSALAYLLGHLGRHDEARRVAFTQLVMAERMDTPDHVGTARHDAGMVALAADRYVDAATMLGDALAFPTHGFSRPAARLAMAEALAAQGLAEEAEAELRRTAEEEIGPHDRPWSLVPRMARVQGLVAGARGDRTAHLRRLEEALAGWRRYHGADRGTEFMTNFVDLGRPPVAGLVEPDREIARLTAEIDTVANGGTCRSSP
ncbi:ATP-binding protein [Pseudonocardia endophytica]|uniref:Transcriptional activator n=1 Tax=Pseudonocardia endophytica TaxID=401976 RepID=A0A4R1HQB2_PSEEN|nr:AAA family ATPase [Pseudonocardia endophytica]TCK22895.1 transcriptional activator [Pseudonocardia endophytica]